MSEGAAEAAVTGDVSRMRRHESDHEIPWAMPIVVLRDKHRPANEVDVCEAAATAVVRMLDDPRARAEGPWHEALEYWREGAIRKVVRRADGKRWFDAQELPGVTVEHGREPAAARAFLPGPVDDVPRALNKLQVGGTTFPADEPSAAREVVVLIELSPLIEITSGKAAAQSAHAAQLAYEGMDEATRERWRRDNFRVRVERPTRPAWWEGERPVRVFDAGFTELDGITETARASW